MKWDALYQETRSGMSMGLVCMGGILRSTLGWIRVEWKKINEQVIS